MPRTRIGIALVAGFLMVAPASAALAQPEPTNPGRGVADLVSAPTPASKARNVFAGRLDDLARHNGMSGADLRNALKDSTAWVDQDARLYYVEPVAPDAARSQPTRSAKRPPKPGVAPTAPALSSLPGSNRTI